MILVDTSVLMYAAGAKHPSKGPSAELLEQIAAGRLEARIDVEVLQELLHRYRALRRWRVGRSVYDLARRIFPEPLPVDVAVVDHARRLLDEHRELSARDAVHAAVSLRAGATCLCSYDRHFDRLPGLVRKAPEEILQSSVEDG